MARPLAWCACWWGIALGQVALAEEPPAPAAAPKPSAPPASDKDRAAGQAPRSGEVKPDIFYLPDKDGTLHPVPGLTLEQLMTWIREREGAVGEPNEPGESLQELRVTGQAAGDRARLTIELVMRTSAVGWHRLPLRLDGAILDSYSGDSAPLVQLDRSGEGYVAWVRSGDAEARSHKLVLSVIVPLASAGGQTQLKLNLPRAAVAGLELEVPVEQAVVQASEGSTVETAKGTSPGKSLLRVRGLGDELELAWRPETAAAARAPVVLEANSTQLVTIDSRSVASDVRLVVRSLDGAFDQFQVRLPPKAELVGGSQTGLSLIPLEGPADQPRLVLVKLQKRSTGPVEIRLLTDRSHGGMPTDGALELAGFEVVGAARQWGSIAVRAMPGWQLRWDPTNNVRAVDELPEPLKRDDLAAGFEYFAAPYSLPVRPLPRTARVSVSPQYVCLVSADQVQLTARLRYVVRGAKVRSVRIDLPGWEVVDLGPPGVVSAEAGDDREGTLLTVPLAQPTAGEFEVLLEARRPIAAGATKLEIALPRPEAALRSAAEVVIQPADNVDLTPQWEATGGLTAAPLMPGVKLPPRQQEPLAFRGEGNNPRFAAEMRVQAQAISVEVNSRVEVDETTLRVQQNFSYQVRHEPLDRLSIGVPVAIPVGQLQATLDHQPLTLAPPRDAAARAGVWRATLPSPRIGRFDVQLNYSLPHDPLSPTASVRGRVPLAMPREGAVGKQRALLSARPGVVLAVPKGSWTVESRLATAGEPATVVATVEGRSDEIPLAITLSESGAEAATIVKRCWIQSWLAATQRQDRAVFRVDTGDRRLRFQLPEGIDAPSIEAALDGARVAAAADARRLLTVPLPAGAARSQHTIELRYRFESRPGRGEMSLAAPQLVGAASVRQTYWQLVVPQHEHLLRSPADLTGEFVWRWDRLGWTRYSTLRQSELETWTGAAVSTTVAPAANEYLFSTAGEARRLVVVTATRTALVLGVSLLVLAIGSLLLYWAPARHPLVLAVAALGLLCGALIDPEAAMLFGQAAVVGLAAVALAGIVARRSRRRAAGPSSTVRGSSFATSDRSATQVRQRVPRPGTQTTTAPASLALHGSSQELKT